MNYYQDITLLPDAENNFGTLWQKVYQQIHIALADNKIAENESLIGLSFPKYSNDTLTLGNKLRLIAVKKSDLEKFNVSYWLERYEDNIHIKSIKPVPSNVTQHVSFTRKHIKGKKRIAKTIQEKAKYQSEKFSIPMDECIEKVKVSAPKPFSPLPFIKVLRSEIEKSEGKNSFNIFIEMELLEQSDKQAFNCYGLSKKGSEQRTTVPWF